MRFYLHVLQADGTVIEDDEGCYCTTFEQAANEVEQELHCIAVNAVEADERAPIVGVIIEDQQGRRQTMMLPDERPEPQVASVRKVALPSK